MFYLVNLIIFCFLNNVYYYLLPKLLKYNNNFNNLTYQKQKYVVKNILKSINLLILIFPSFYLLKCLYYGYKLDNYYIKNFASFYVSNDILGLIKIKDLPFSTLFHHLMTTLLLFVNYTIDYENLENTSLANLLIIYTCFSCYSFTVNMYLGTRFLIFKKEDEIILTKNQVLFNEFVEYLRISSFYIYFICIIINWSYQILNIIYYPITVSRVLYIIALSPIINDDIVLLTWLKYKKIN